MRALAVGEQGMAGTERARKEEGREQAEFWQGQITPGALWPE
jgi:hypothetical protein